MAELIQELTGCTQFDAEEALKKFHGNVVDAVEFLIVKPKVRGDAYIPIKPKINNGLSPEQEEMCRRGRELQDKVNAVFSVAHSQTLHEHSDQGPEGQGHLSGKDETKVPLTLSDERAEDVLSKNLQSIPQSEMPL